MFEKVNTIPYSIRQFCKCLYQLCKNKFGDLFIKFKCVNKTVITPDIIEVLNKLFPPLVVIPDVKESDLIEKKLENVTESDLEFFDSDTDEYDSEEEFSDSDCDSEESE